MTDLRPITFHDLRATDKRETPYPDRWRDVRGQQLLHTLHAIQNEIGRQLHITRGPAGGGYAPLWHALKHGRSERSRHVIGAAADFQLDRPWDPRSVAVTILNMRDRGQLPYLGGLGVYPAFVHVDIRRWGRRPRRLRQWGLRVP